MIRALQGILLRVKGIGSKFICLWCGWVTQAALLPSWKHNKGTNPFAGRHRQTLIPHSLDPGQKIWSSKEHFAHYILFIDRYQRFMTTVNTILFCWLRSVLGQKGCLRMDTCCLQDRNRFFRQRQWATPREKLKQAAFLDAETNGIPLNGRPLNRNLSQEKNQIQGQMHNIYKPPE